MKISIKRVYEVPSIKDGPRVLVDRLWPRGVSKQAAALVAWLREIAPSESLRESFCHDPARWVDFKRRYFRELDANADLVRTLLGYAHGGMLTLVFAAKDEQHNNALALKEFLETLSSGKIVAPARPPRGAKAATRAKASRRPSSTLKPRRR